MKKKLIVFLLCFCCLVYFNNVHAQKNKEIDSLKDDYIIKSMAYLWNADTCSEEYRSFVFASIERLFLANDVENSNDLMFILGTPLLTHYYRNGSYTLVYPPSGSRDLTNCMGSILLCFDFDNHHQFKSTHTIIFEVEDIRTDKEYNAWISLKWNSKSYDTATIPNIMFLNQPSSIR